MRGVRAKRERKLGLRSGPRKREDKSQRVIPDDERYWHRTTALIPNPVIEADAEGKRQRRRDRNIRNGWRGAFAK